MSAAEVLAEHRKSWNVSSAVAVCTAAGCDWSAFGTITRTDAAHAAHQLDALKAAGYEVVELPKPVFECDTATTWLHAERVGPEVRVASVTRDVTLGQDLTRDEARDIAADLLAAAADEPGHWMLPGSHERLSGPECRCGAAWNHWADRCARVRHTAAEAAQ